MQDGLDFLVVGLPVDARVGLELLGRVGQGRRALRLRQRVEQVALDGPSELDHGQAVPRLGEVQDHQVERREDPGDGPLGATVAEGDEGIARRGVDPELHHPAVAGLQTLEGARRRHLVPGLEQVAHGARREQALAGHAAALLQQVQEAGVVEGRAVEGLRAEQELEQRRIARAPVAGPVPGAAGVVAAGARAQGMVAPEHAGRLEHAERREESLAEEVLEGHPADHLDQRAQRVRAVVAVLVARARREVGSAPAGERGDVLLAGDLGHVRADQAGEREAARVRQQVLDGDRARDLGVEGRQVARDRVAGLELSSSINICTAAPTRALVIDRRQKTPPGSMGTDSSRSRQPKPRCSTRRSPRITTSSAPTIFC